jgi:hypothetical protein
MVNNDMTQNIQKSAETNKAATPTPKRPNETGAISVEAHVRIFDPATKETFVEKRA